MSDVFDLPSAGAEFEEFTGRPLSGRLIEANPPDDHGMGRNTESSPIIRVRQRGGALPISELARTGYPRRAVLAEVDAGRLSAE